MLRLLPSAVACADTALLTPFEVGFLAASTTVDVWFVINRVLDGVRASRCLGREGGTS